MPETKIVVGLGNPGSEYEDTRHNAGFKVIDLLAKALDIDVRKQKFGARFGIGRFKDNKLILLKPWQFMNLSGQAVATAMGYYRLDVSDLLVISDDLDLEPGRVRIKPKGSAGGQKGLADVIRKLGTNEVGRLRIGIGQSDIIAAVDYVLGKPGKKERLLLDEALIRAREAVFCWIENGIEEAMNKFNATGQKQEK